MNYCCHYPYVSLVGPTGGNTFTTLLQYENLPVGRDHPNVNYLVVKKDLRTNLLRTTVSYNILYELHNYYNFDSEYFHHRLAFLFLQVLENTRHL